MASRSCSVGNASAMAECFIRSVLNGGIMDWSPVLMTSICLQIRRHAFGKPLETALLILGFRLRTHNQNMTVAARAMADRNTFGHRS